MPRPVRLEPDPGAMATSAGRRDLQRASVALATSACPEKKGPLEKAGEKADEAIDKAKDAVK